MKNTKTTPWFLTAIVGVLLVSSGTARAQRLYLVVGRDTGMVQAVSSADVDVDGYSISSPAGRLDPDAWNSLTDQAVTGWREANPQSELLAELNWESSTSLTAREPVSLGTAYAGGQLLPREEDLGFQYTRPEGTVHDASVFYTGPSQLPTITVDRGSGLVELSNPGGFDITAYTIASPSGALNPDGLNGLADQSLDGWTEANPTSSLISELNFTSSLAFGGTSKFSLGNAYTATSVGGEDLSFEYATPEGVIAEGVVDFTGPINDLVLQVDLLSGEASIQNTSPIAGPFDIFGYSVTSESGSLLVDNWTSFSDTGAGGEGWAESNPSANAIAELNPTSSTLFDENKSISIGNILGGVDDLVFEYGTADGASFGSVEYILDLGTCEDIAGSRIGGDIDGDGTVQFSDFSILAENFGQSVSGYEQGDIDCDGMVQFTDFSILAENFGQSAGAVAAAVPEPASSVMAVLGMLFLLAIRKRR